MGRRIRHHVNPLTIRHMDTGAERLSLPADRPVEVELGCAEGEFLFNRCAVDPARSYVGVEIRAPLVEDINALARDRSLPQVQAVYANLMSDLEVVFGQGSVDLCHVNFPDPCFKRSQHKRRFFTPALTRALSRVIKPGGQLAFQSDIYDLGLETLDALEQSEAFENERGSWCFTRRNPFGARSRRERFCHETGQRVWRLRFRRCR